MRAEKPGVQSGGDCIKFPGLESTAIIDAKPPILSRISPITVSKGVVLRIK
jgi:hypothetical protein